MRPELFIYSLIVALVFLPLLAWKWRIKIRLAVAGGIIIGGLTGLIINGIDSAWDGANTVVLVIIALCVIIAITFMIFGLRFYRDPERSPREVENVILSPADGTVVYTNEVEESSSLVSTKGTNKYRLDEITSTDLVNNATYLVGIDMNILNVHVNRSPIEGKIILCKRTKGKFISLRRQESDVLNERVTTVIDNGKFLVGVVQIASRLVRRINTYIKEGDSLAIGQRIGAIVFGSQVDVVIPELDNLRIKVKPGDEVKASITIIATYGKGKNSAEILPKEGKNGRTA
jgi:phosphatidylserine decarboxylase